MSESEFIVWLNGFLADAYNDRWLLQIKAKLNLVHRQRCQPESPRSITINIGPDVSDEKLEKVISLLKELK
jgi:hypothetical protein